MLPIWLKMLLPVTGLLVFLVKSSLCVAPDTLELVQIVWRHGDRSPTDELPIDPNKWYWTDGYGMLTNIGKQQHFALGQYIRERYSGFLNDSYVHAEILINSTDVDRTLMSAYCNLAGLYPPAGVQEWSEDIAWQPIPVHTRPEEMDYIVDADSYCPLYRKLFDAVQQSPELQEINAEYADLYALATSETGYDVHDIFSLNKVYDSLFCDKCHDLPLPDWAIQRWDDLEYLHNLKYLYEYGLPSLSRLTGGDLLGHMIDNMKLKVAGKIEQRKAFLFSSHDTKLVAFLAALNMWDEICPPYAGAVFVELHKLSDGDHGVQIFYRNDTTVDPFLLTVPGCVDPCPLDELEALTKEKVPEDIVKECTTYPTHTEELLWEKAMNLLK